MKFGSAITFMFLSFIALGYLLSDNFNMREDLTLVQQENQKLLEENAALHDNNESLIQALSESEQKVRDLTQVNSAQQQKINSLTEENSSLKSVVSGPECQVENSNLLMSLANIPLAWAILLPVIPASLAVSYGIVYYTRTNSRRSSKKGQRMEYVQLTGDEIEKVIQMRRRK